LYFHYIGFQFSVRDVSKEGSVHNDLYFHCIGFQFSIIVVNKEGPEHDDLYFHCIGFPLSVRVVSKEGSVVFMFTIVVLSLCLTGEVGPEFEMCNIKYNKENGQC
jgi:hypothetical protein